MPGGGIARNVDGPAFWANGNMAVAVSAQWFTGPMNPGEADVLIDDEYVEPW
jgi:hypothetical protein